MDSQDSRASPSIFLSYARADRAKVEPLAAALQDAGIDVWWDDRLEGGQAFANEIETALDRSDVVIVVWSGTSIRSDWVRDEAARGRGRGRLVPVCLDGCDAPLGFGQYHAIDFSGWRGGSDAPEMQRLVAAIVTAAGSAAPATRPGPSHRGPSRRSMIVGGSVAAVAAAGGGAWLLSDRLGFGPKSDGAPGNSIAVLPFTNLSGDPAQAYFSDGVAEELRAALARDTDLRVAARTSSNAVRDSEDDAAAIAARLGVAFLLDGSVRRSGEVVRVAAELIEAATGFTSWSQSFDRRLSDIFAIQRDIAKTVAKALSARFGSAQTAADGGTQAGGTANAPAYDAYLHGKGLFELGGDEKAYRAALAQFDAAVTADPNYADAHAARARTLAAIANQFASGDALRPLYDASIAAAGRAVALAPRLADAHSALGYALFNGRMDIRGAREPYARSRALGGGDADVLIRYALYAARTGGTAAGADAIGRAIALDRLNPRAYRAQGNVLYAARRYADSIPPLRRALALNPTMAAVHAGIGDALLMLGKTAEARAEYAAEPLAFVRLSGLAIAERKLGRSAAADAAMARLIADHGDSALYQQAQVRAQWGESEQALSALEKARTAGDAGLIYLRNDPLLDPVRTAPRFRELLRAVGFE